MSLIGRRIVASVVITATAGCSSNSSGTVPPPAPTEALAKVAGDNQTATVSSAVAVAPAVKITNQQGAGIAGVSVTFVIASGSGSVTGASQTTGNDGVATVGSWTLGATAGANRLTATASGATGSPVTFAATGIVAQPLTKVGGDNQTAAAGLAVPIPPAVKVTNPAGQPLSGVTVTFAVATGAGR